MIKETRKDISQYEYMYQASDNGKIKSLNRTIIDKLGRSFVFCEKILKPCVDQHGYNKITLCKNGVQTSYRLHRIIAITFIPNINNLPAINHKDGNKLNNNVNNLKWISHSENQKHAFQNKINLGTSGKIDQIYKNKTHPIVQIDTHSNSIISVYLGALKFTNKKLPRKCERCNQIKHRLKNYLNKKICFSCLYALNKQT